MRIAVGGFAQESNSFSPVPGSWDHFGPQEVLVGDDLLARLSGTQLELGAAIDRAQSDGIDLAPLVYASASSSAGHVRADVFRTILANLTDRLAQTGPIDGVLLALHGAMVVEDCDDGTGEVLRAVRAVVGPHIPVVGTLDLHANVTARMVSNATALVGYHTAPHVDQAQTGLRGLRLLCDTIAGRANPVCALRRLPMLLPGETARTTDGPYAEVMRRAEASMMRDGILDASVFSVQPWLDVEDVGCSVLVVSDSDPELAGTVADQLGDEFWQRRRDFGVDLVPTADAIRRALISERHPFVLADSADAPSSGAPGDSTIVLRALLEANPSRDCYHNIVDGPVARAMAEAGVGQTVTVSVGARLAPALYEPVEVTGRVSLIADGDFVQKWLGGGEVLHRGLTGVLQIGRVHLVVMERAVRQWDPEMYRSVGLEPRDAQIVIVKSPAGFRAAYEPFAAEVAVLDAAGVCSPNLRALPFRRVRRPLYPLDDF
ncbi:MAG: M81 family metallopeptidase [Chloroflexi bacterium]|nr:M81 family metallopeptidase [Chloroflexota bacterium]